MPFCVEGALVYSSDFLTINLVVIILDYYRVNPR